MDRPELLRRGYYNEAPRLRSERRSRWLGGATLQGSFARPICELSSGVEGGQELPIGEGSELETEKAMGEKGLFGQKGKGYMKVW